MGYFGGYGVIIGVLGAVILSLICCGPVFLMTLGAIGIGEAFAGVAIKWILTGYFVILTAVIIATHIRRKYR